MPLSATIVVVAGDDDSATLTPVECALGSTATGPGRGIGESLAT
jgi:hypothetical protein